SRCHTEARKGQDQTFLVTRLPPTRSTFSFHSSTSRKIEWLRLPNSTGGRHFWTCIAWLDSPSADRSPLHSQPDSSSGGRDPLVPTGRSEEHTSELQSPDHLV